MLCVAMIATLLPMNALAAEDSVVSLTGNATISSYVIGDATWNYNNTASLGNIADVEAQMQDRLIDGVLGSGKEFSSSWVQESWDVESGTRNLYVNMYRGDSRDITVDLGSVMNVTEVALHIMISTGYGISQLSSVTFYLSENGTDYYEVGVVTSDEATADAADPEGLSTTDPSHLYYTLDGLNYNAQYVRVVFPVSVWAFVDEIIVNGYTTASESADAYDDATRLIEDEVSKESYATTEQSGGVTQEYLAYQGWGTVNSVITETYKTVSEYKAAIAYVDSEGVATDWLYDGVTVLGHAYTADGGLYVISGTTNTDYATKDDWSDWLDHVFYYTVDGEVTNMDALEAAVAEAKEEMVEAGVLTQEEADAYKVQVKLAVYPTIYTFSDWGSVDETVKVTVSADGSLSYEILDEEINCDFTLEGNNNDAEATLSARASAYYWYLKQAATMFEEKGYSNIELAGFYYFNERIYVTDDSLAEDTIVLYNMLVDEVAEEISKDKLYSYWIPFYGAEGYRNWEAYGFDYAILQPNAYGYGQTRLDATADTAYFYGMGVEMEWMGYSSADYIDTFVQYLTTGASKEYQGTVQAWYWGTWALPQLAESTTYRYIYDLVYNYIKGIITYDDNLLSAANISVKFRTTPTDTNLSNVTSKLSYLTDGIYGDDAVWASNVVQINNNNTTTPTMIIADLAETSLVKTFFMSFYNWTSAGVYMPSRVEYYVSADGENWQLVGAVTEDEDYTLELDEAIVTNYVMAKVYNKAVDGTMKAWVGIEEFIVTGTSSAKTASVYQISDEENLMSTIADQVSFSLTDSEGTAVSASNSNDFSVLIDGAYGSSWNSSYYCWSSTSVVDPFALTIDLGESCYISAASLSFYEWISAGVGVPEEGITVEVSTDGETWTTVGTSYQVDMVGSYSDVYNVDMVCVFDEAVFANYVRISFARSLNLYSQASRNNWIALGEVKIAGLLATDVCIAEPLTEDLLTLDNVDSLTLGYTGTANSTGEARLAAIDAVKEILMDGENGGHYPYSYNASGSAYIGFNWGDTGSYNVSEYNYGYGNDGYWIELALDAYYDITGLAINFLHYPVTGISAPDEVSFYVSEDGETWTLVGTVAYGQSITSDEIRSGETQQNYVINLSEAVTAAYIRYEFKLAEKTETTTYSFVMFDEIQVAGTLNSAFAAETATISFYDTFGAESAEEYTLLAEYELEIEQYITVYDVATLEETYTDYQFVGWMTEDGTILSAEELAAVSVTEDASFYAVWEPVEEEEPAPKTGDVSSFLYLAGLLTAAGTMGVTCKRKKED